MLLFQRDDMSNEMYDAPQLEELGSVEEVTGADTAGTGDGGSLEAVGGEI